MTFIPNAFDVAVLAMLAGALAVETASSGRLRAAILAGSPTARLHVYKWSVISSWGICFVILGLWAGLSRPWQSLFLGDAASWRLALGLALGSVFVWLNFRDRRVLLARPDVLAKFRRHFDPLAHLMPRSMDERQWWVIVSITAGITEEIVCRGYLLALVAHFATLWIAAPIAALLFGIGHAYQGSLLPAIIVHCIVDLISGDIGNRIVAAEEAA